MAAVSLGVSWTVTDKVFVGMQSIDFNTLVGMFLGDSPRRVGVSQIEPARRISSFWNIEATGCVLTFSQRFAKRNIALEVEWNAHYF